MANKTISLSNPDQIEELIIEPHTILDNDGNQLVAKPLGGTLNLSIFKNATTIDCSNNAISDVGLLPESIEFFDCENNNVSELNQSFDVPETIKDLNFKNNDLGSIDIDKILQRTLENNINGIIGDGNYRKLDLEGNDPPSLVGIAYKEDLELLNWEINTEPFVGDRTFTLSNVPTPPLVAYSLRNLFDPSANVVRVRRSFDSAESDFTGSDIESGVMTEWVRYADLPLDIQMFDDFNSPPSYERDGGAIQPRVAYGLRNLGTGANQWTYGGDTLEYESDFSAGVDGWYTVNTTHTANIDGIGGRDDCLQVAPNTTLDQHFIGLSSAFTTGSSYTISFDFYIPSSNVDLDGIDSREGAGSGSLIVDEHTPALDTWVSVSGTHTGDGNSELRIRPLNGGNEVFSFNGTDVFYIRNIKVYETLGDTELLPSGKYIAQVRRNLDNTIKSFTADEITDGTLETFVKAENLVYESDFSANANGWNGNHWGVITTANQDNILGRDDCLKCELSNFNSHDHVVVRGVSDLPQAKVRYQVDVYVPSSNAIVDGIRLQPNGGSGGENFKNLKGNAWHTLSTNLNLSGANQIRVVALSSDKTWYPGNDTDLFYIRNVKVFSVAENTLPLDETASAAYSIDNYEESGTDVTTSGDTGGDNTGKYVIQVQRSFDNEIRSFTANEVDDGTMENWVKVTYDASLSPLDQATGASAAYSLRNLSSSYTNYVVRVRRNIDSEEENFAAPGVTDGTLESFVKGEEVIYESDFSAGEDGWTRAYPRVTIEGNIDGIGGRDNCLKITTHDSGSPWFGRTSTIQKGARYKVSYEFYTEGNFAIHLVSNGYSSSGVSNGNWVSYEADFISDNNNLQFVRPHNDYPAYIRNVKVISYIENELPLDQATGAAAAYSLRNLSSSYIGDVVEVRRSSDAAVQSFTASEVADGTLENWVGGQNLLKSSQEFNSGWSTHKIDTSNWNDVAVAPDGTTTAYEIKDDSTFGRHRISQYSIPLTVGKTYTISGYIKKNSDNRYFFLNGGHTFGVNGSVNLDTMEYKASTGANPTLTDAGNGWYRFSMTGIAKLAAGYIFYQLQDAYFSDSEYQGDGSSFYLWGTQIEEGSTVGAYAPTTTNISGDGFVRTWYDQSGSDNHAVQTTPANQPTIVEGGVILDGINIDATNENLVLPSTSILGISGSNARTVMAVMNSEGVDDGFMPLGGWNGTDSSENHFKNYRLRAAASDGTARVEVAGYNTPSSVDVSDGNKHLISSILSGTTTADLDISGDGTISAGSGTDTIDTGDFPLYVGFIPNRTQLGFGSIQELIIYNSDQSTKRRAIEENIANHYDISLAAFSRDGTVSTWYDQSGNTNDATQTDPTKQPKIIQNGEYLGELHFDGSNDYLSNSDIGAYQSSDGVGFFCAYSKDAASTSDSFGGTNPQYLLQLRDTGLTDTTFAARVLGGKFNVIRADEVSGFNTSQAAAHTIGKSLVLSSVTGTQAVNLFENGSELSLQTDESGLSYDSATTNLIIGSQDTGTRFLDGGIKEMIIYKTDQTNNRKLIEKNILNYYKIPHTSFWDGTIRTWYDQTGKENHNIETDVKKQLKIVDDGITNQSITTTAGNTASVAYSLRSLGTNQWTSKKETTVYQSNFEVQDGWSWNIGGVAIPTNDTIASYNDWLKFISDSSDDEHLLANHLMTVGEKYRLTFEFFIPESNQKINGIQFRDNHRIYGTFNNLEKGKLHKISMPMAHGCASTPVKLRGMYNGHAVFVGVEGDAMYIRNVELRKFNGETEELNPDRYVVQIRRESDGMVKSFTADNLKENIEAFCGEADINDTRPAIPSNRYLEAPDITTEIIDRRSSVKFTLNGTTDSRYLYLTRLGIGKYKFTGSIHVKYKDKESAGWTSPISFYLAYSTLSRPLYDESNGTTGTTYTWTDDDPLIIEATSPNRPLFLYTHGTGNDLISVPNAEITVTNFAIQQIHTDAYVTAWYDQSGNENHAEQIDTAQQPKIVDAGNLVKDSNNEPQISFDGTQYLNKPEFTQGILTKPISSFTVFERNGGAYIHDSYNSHKRFALEQWAHHTIRLFNGATLDTSTTIGKGDKSLVNMRSDGANSYIAINGATPYSNENHTGNHDMSGIVIGAPNDRRDTHRLNGFIQEIIIYDSDQFTKRRIIEENIANHYDITLPALSRDGTVSTWYDQSGNNIHLTPAQPEHEPKIVSDGVIVRDRNGKIALNGNKARLNFPATTDFFSSDGSQSLFMVYDFADQKDVSTNNGLNNDIVNLRADTGVQKLKVRVAKPSGEIEVITNDDSNMYTYNNSDTITSQQLTYTFDVVAGRTYASLDKSSPLLMISGITQNTDRDIASPTSSVRSWIFDNAETVDTYISEFIYYDFDTLGYNDFLYIEDAVKPGSTGYVSIWYDQSGNNHDVSQSTAERQPWIVKDGEYIGHIQFDSVQGTRLANSNIGPFQISSGIGFFCNYNINSITSEGEPSYGGTLVNIYDSVDIFSAHLYMSDPYGSRNVRPQIFRRDLNDTKTLITRSKDIITEDKFNLFSAVGESELTLFNNTAKLDLERDDISTSATTTAGELSIGSTRGLGSFIDGGINEIILYQENINPTLQRFIETDIILHHNI